MSNDIMINNKMKDRLFRLLFGTEEYKQNALDLYNAVNRSNYDNIDDLEFNTIDDVIYMKMKNDVSFLFLGGLNLYEHQSSINPNMPLRGLMYLAKLFDKVVETGNYNIYGETLIKLPTPKYVVFYNGIKEIPDKMQYKLSDSFDGPGCVEMIADVYNINYGHNSELLDACKTLNDYSLLIQRIRNNQQTMSQEEAIKQAIDSCITDGILQNILSSHKAEVIDMCITEYNEAKTMNMFKAEGRAEGRAEGKIEEHNTLVSNIRNNLQKQHPEWDETRLDKEVEALIKAC